MLAKGVRKKSSANIDLWSVLFRMEKMSHVVEPKTDCPHWTDEHVLDRDWAHSNVTEACSTCSDTAENWLCLACGLVACSRYVNEHMSMHSETAGHPLVVSFSDLSIWCNACER